MHCNDQLALGPRLLMGRYLELHTQYAALQQEMGHFEIPEWLLHFYLTQHIGCGFKTLPTRYNFQR